MVGVRSGRRIPFQLRNIVVSKMPGERDLITQPEITTRGRGINGPLTFRQFLDVRDGPIEMIRSDVDAESLQGPESAHDCRKEYRVVFDPAGSARHQAFGPRF